jgi:hypothetical protein
MGRPPLRKKGAFTAAERQRRRRKRLAREKRTAERVIAKAKNDAYWAAKPQPVHVVSISKPEDIALPDRADEIAAQIAEALIEAPDLTIDDIRAAIDRRWK